MVLIADIPPRGGMAIAAASLAMACALPVAAATAGDVEKGRALAERHCSRCHVVGTHNPLGGANNTASFQMIIRMSDGLERFQTFYARRPHPVFVRVPDVPRWSDQPSHVKEFEVTPGNIEDLVAFVRTLRPK